MQTFLFSELTERGQRAAIKRYAPSEWSSEMYLEASKSLFMSWGWRFTEHGERIG